MTTLREHLEEQMNNPAFRKAWEESELGYQIAHALIKLRLELGLTQEELARKAGVPQSVIARLESGRHLPSLRSLEKLARRLGLRVEVSLSPIPAGGGAPAL